MPAKLFFTSCFLIICSAILAQVNCDTVLPPPSESAYRLPYPPGKTYKIIQANCPAIGGHANTFAYDFDTQTGDTIVACRTGFVIWVNEQYADNDWANGHENNVFIRHNDGTVIRYTHLKQNGVFVSANMPVAQGQLLGLSGSSGNTGGVPHLHLQAFRDGTSYDKWNAIPINFSNADGPVNSQNLLMNGQSYTATNTTSVAENDLHGSAATLAIYPNPTSGLVYFDVEGKKGGIVRLDIIDDQGRIVQIVFNGKLSAGQFHFSWDGHGQWPAGAYLVRLDWNGQKVVKKLVLK